MTVDVAMAAEVRTALEPEQEPLAFAILAAVILHVGVLSSLLLAAWLQQFLDTKRPPIAPDHAMEVSMMVLPRTSPVVQRASHAPTRQGDTPKAQEPAPIRESDLAVQRPNAEKTQGNPTTNAREEQIREMLMLQALSDLDSPEGQVDRPANDPNSDSEEAINASGAGLRSDPELAKYYAAIQKLFHDHWNPLPSVVASNPGIQCAIRVQINPETGEITGYEFIEPSGNESYDRSAESAVQAVPRVPLPPERFRGVDGYRVHFP